MIHEGYVFEFPGHTYEFRHADLDGWLLAATSAVRALHGVVEPGVVEAMLEGEQDIHHLVATNALGGSYTRDAARTVSATAIDQPRFLEWLGEITRHGAAPIASLSLRDGWYLVDAKVGDVIRLRDGNGFNTASVIDRHSVAAIVTPDGKVMLPPFRFKLDSETGTLRISVHWSPWIDPDGVGRKRFDRMREELSTAGWKLVKEPDPRHLDWRSWTPEAPIIPLPTRPAGSGATEVANVAWSNLHAATLVLGLSVAEREQLVDKLLTIDREATEAEQSFGYHEYPTSKRREEIRVGLATSLGHSEINVAPCEIMRTPVTNAMWTHYMKATGAARPTSWAGSASPPNDHPVSGISQSEAAAFAAHHGWALPTEAEWQHAATTGSGERFLDGFSEYTSDLFAPYPQADLAAFTAAAPQWQGQACARGSAPKVPACIPARRGLARDHRFKFARFRCIRRI